MANLTLVYGMRLLPAEDIVEVGQAPVKLANGKEANLWVVKIPLDPGRLSSFSDLDIVEIELTKQVLPFRSYPDPIIYGAHQAGAPSSVHVFGATLTEAPFRFEPRPERFGHVWTAPEVPAYVFKIANSGSAVLRGTLGDMATQVLAAGVKRTAVIIVGQVLAAEGFRDSHLYSAERSRRSR